MFILFSSLTYLFICESVWLSGRRSVMINSSTEVAGSCKLLCNLFLWLSGASSESFGVLLDAALIFLHPFLLCISLMVVNLYSLLFVFYKAESYLWFLKIIIFKELSDFSLPFLSNHCIVEGASMRFKLWLSE